MYITYIGHNHIHDMDFKIERPNGCKDYLVLLIKSPAEFQLEGKTLYTQSNIFFLYAKDTPQYYKAHEITLSTYYFQRLYKKGFGISCLRDIINHPQSIAFYIKTIKALSISNSAN